MCYPNSKLVIKIHHIDAEPFVLIGMVNRCEYDTDSMYDIEVSLEAARNRDVLGKTRPTARSRVARATRA